MREQRAGGVATSVEVEDGGRGGALRPELFDDSWGGLELHLADRHPGGEREPALEFVPGRPARLRRGVWPEARADGAHGHGPPVMLVAGHDPLPYPASRSKT